MAEVYLTKKAAALLDSEPIPQAWEEILPNLIGKKRMAKFLKISLPSLNKLIKEKKIPYYKINLTGGRSSRIVFEPSSIQDWYLDKMEGFGPGEPGDE